jgi:hypothetical protein
LTTTFGVEMDDERSSKPTLSRNVVDFDVGTRSFANETNGSPVESLYHRTIT